MLAEFILLEPAGQIILSVVLALPHLILFDRRVATHQSNK